MVNITKRMSVFQPKLLDIRHGKGAHVLPPAPAPQLTRVFLRYPRRHGLKPDSRTDGANQFHTQYLPRLKYYNPTLNINVKNHGNTHATMKLVLVFEATDQNALKAIAKKSTRVKEPRLPLHQPGQPVQPVQPVQPTQEELEAAAQLQSPNWRFAPGPEVLKDEAQQTKGELEAETQPQSPKQKPKQQPNEPRNADNDKVRLQARPVSELGVQSNVPVYTRSVTLAVNSRPHWEIWRWFKKRTGAEAAPMTDADKQLKHKINKESQQREIDRKEGAIVAVKLRHEREALEKAKKAADEAATRTS